MNIISINGYVAGVFAKWDDALAYIAIKPETLKGFSLKAIDVQYPFFLVEYPFGEFEASQTVPQTENGTVYTLTEDYKPMIPWTDNMGELDHRHPGEEL